MQPIVRLLVVAAWYLRNVWRWQSRRRDLCDIVEEQLRRWCVLCHLGGVFMSLLELRETPLPTEISCGARLSSITG